MKNFHKNICANCGSNRILKDNSRNPRNIIVFNRMCVVTGDPFVCCDCGFVSRWVDIENAKEKDMLEKAWKKLNPHG